MANIKMEVGFDKEIDALMRSGGGGRTITISEFAAPHLGADELNAFAENALPDAARKGYMTHLADCDGCRKTLSSLIGFGVPPLGGEFSREESLLKQELQATVPWYKSLFAVQNLAYGMGALVVLFAGFIGYIVLQNTGMGDSAYVSQVANTQPAPRGPMEPEPETFAANTANTASPANANSSSPANRSVTDESPAKTAANTIAGSDLAIAADKPVAATEGVEMAAPPPPAITALPEQPREPRSEDDEAKAKTDDQIVLRQQEKLPSAGNVPNTQTGPTRSSVQRDSSVFADRDRTQKRAAAPALGRVASPSKTVSGKNFSKRDNVWYDSAYSGQATTNIRRSTEDYRKLDSGLRTIAESLDGTVVVVWKSKAYRIQ